MKKCNKLLSLVLVIAMVVAMIPTVLAEGSPSVNITTAGGLIHYTVGKTTQLSATKTNADDFTIHYFGDNPNVATVNESTGLMTYTGNSGTVRVYAELYNATTASGYSSDPVTFTVSTATGLNFTPSSKSLSFDAKDAGTSEEPQYGAKVISFSIIGGTKDIDVVKTENTSNKDYFTVSDPVLNSDGISGTITVTPLKAFTGTKYFSVKLNDKTDTIGVTITDSTVYTKPSFTFTGTTAAPVELIQGTSFTNTLVTTTIPEGVTDITYKTASTDIISVDSSTGLVTILWNKNEIKTATVTAYGKRNGIEIELCSYVLKVYPQYYLEVEAPASITAGSSSNQYASATLYAYTKNDGSYTVKKSIVTGGAEIVWSSPATSKLFLSDKSSAAAKAKTTDQYTATAATATRSPYASVCYLYDAAFEKEVELTATYNSTYSASVKVNSFYTSSATHAAISLLSGATYTLNDTTVTVVDNNKANTAVLCKTPLATSSNYQYKITGITRNPGKYFTVGSQQSDGSYVLTAGKTAGTDEITLAIAIYNPKAELISETTCTFKATVSNGSIQYIMASGETMTFDEDDFVDFYQDAYSKATYKYVTSVTFTKPSKGTLYNDGKKVTASTVTVKYADISDITFEAPTTKKPLTISIPFTINGTSTYGDVAGEMIITVTAGKMSTTSVGTTFYKLGVTDLVEALADAADLDPTYVTIEPLSASEGTLYLGFNSLSKMGTAVTSSTKLYLDNSKYDELDDVYFLPAAGCKSPVTFVYYYDGVEKKASTGTFQIYVDQVTSSAQFTDVKSTNNGYWSADSIDFLYNFGVIKGLSTYTFGLDNNMTRGDFVLMLYRLSGSKSVSITNPFKDVTTADYYYDAVMWALKNGIVSSDTKFNAKANITREQIAAILFRYTGSNSVTGSLSAYADSAKVSTYAVSAMKWAVKYGYVEGSNYNLNPQKNATRAEVAVILHRFLTK